MNTREHTVDAYGFNGQVPGPTLRFREGDRVRIVVINHLPETTTVPWHGLILPNIMDGPAHITQKPIENGQIYRYAFTSCSRARTGITRTTTSIASRRWDSMAP